MHWSWQNLNDSKEKRGSGWRHGRAWLWFGRTREAHPSQKCIGLEWTHWSSMRCLSLTLTTGGHDSDVLISLGLIVGCWYLSFSGFLPREALYRDGFGRETGVSFDGDDLRLYWRADTIEWPTRVGWTWRWSLLDTFLGRMQYREGTPERSPLVISMPEGDYHGTCEMRDDSWKRPRWFRQVIRRADIVMAEGRQVPVPGKGENAWDCGEDAIYASTFPAASVAEAVAKFTADALRTRERHGGRDWRPKKTGTP